MPRTKSRTWRLIAVLLAGTMLLAACGSDEEEGSPGTTGGDKECTQTNTAKIALIVPLSGSLSALGLGMKNSVDLAVKQANEECRIEGWKIEFTPEDDTATANVGAQVATKVASDAATVAVIGTLNSSVAQQVQPILNQAKILMISPANTGVALTGRDNLTAQKRPFESYFRVATTDDIQGPFAANYAYDDAMAKKVAVIHDKKTYGQGLAEAFSAQFKKKGGTVVATETVNPGDKDFSAVLAKIKPLAPDLIYYGGEYPEAGLISSQAEQQGIKAPLMGGDGIYDGTYITTGGAATEGDLATSVGAPAEKLDSAKEFIKDYEAAGYAEPFSAYGAYAYDAANVIIDALAKALEGEDAITPEVRQAIIDAVQDTEHDGVTGEVSFDKFGDTTNKTLTVYKVTSGKWAPSKTGELES